MTLKFKNPALNMVLVKGFLENMCALSVSLHFLRALSLLSEREHTKSVKTQRERAQKINRERESTHFCFSLCLFSGPYNIGYNCTRFLNVGPK